jgi:DNA-binding phage protein
VLVEVENHTHLHKVLKAVRKVKGVTEIARRDSGSAEVVSG